MSKMPWLLLLLMSAAAVANADELASSSCVYREDIASCVWNLAAPLVSSGYAVPEDEQGRGLVQAAFLLDYCTKQSNSSQSTCTSLLLDSKQACSWRQPTPGHAALLGLTATTSPICLPLDDSLLSTHYLDLTAPDQCANFDITKCGTSYKCKLEEHEGHQDCLVVSTFVQQRLGSTGALAEQAQKLQQLCAPETNGEAHTERPAKLSREQCAAAGPAIDLDSEKLRQLAVKAGVPGASAVVLAEDDHDHESETGNDHADEEGHTDEEGDDHDHDHEADASGTAANQTSTAATNTTSASAAGPAPATSTSGSGTGCSGASGQVVSAPSCQRLSTKACAPTLLSLAAAASPNMGDAPAAARDLLSASLKALQCIASSTAATTTTVDACVQAAMPSNYESIFSPSCTGLSESACLRNPACSLQAHGSHSDCARRTQFVTAALGGGAVADQIQLMTSACRASSTCGAERTAVTVTMVDLLTESQRVWSAAPAPTVVTEQGGHSHNGLEETKPLRIAAVFIILVSGALGCMLPLVLRDKLQEGKTATILLRSLSAGVLLSLALIHVITHAMELDGVDEYSENADSHRRLSRRLLQEEAEEESTAHNHPFPLGMCAVGFGFLLVVFLEHLIHGLSHRWSSHNHDHQHSQDPAAEAEAGAITKQCAPEVGILTTEGNAGKGGDLYTRSHDNHGHSHVQAFPHHACIHKHEAPLTESTMDPHERLRHHVYAIVFELGCVMHSFIIGLSLGVANSVTEARALLIALCFHQALEGMSLGMVFIRAQLATRSMLWMVALYSLTCPVGVAIGIGISSSYDSESLPARAAQGTINGVAGGMLLYLSMALILTEFGTAGVAASRSIGMRLLSFLLLCIGFGGFAVLALWA